LRHRENRILEAMIRTGRTQQQSAGDPAASGQAMHSGSAPRWVNGLFIALVIYASTMTAWMLCGIGGPTVTHYVGLLSDLPAALITIIIPTAPARYCPRGALRSAWAAVAVARGLYFIGTAIGVSSWLQQQDPFPGPADIFYCAFCLVLAGASLAFIRA